MLKYLKVCFLGEFMNLEELKENLQDNALGRGLLWSASKLYGVGAWFHRAMYENGWKTAESVNSRVVCIGNITAGGTGKTTAVLLDCFARLQTPTKNRRPRGAV